MIYIIKLFKLNVNPNRSKLLQKIRMFVDVENSIVYFSEKIQKLRKLIMDYRLGRG